MTSTRPYLVRALYEWIVDNDMTPQILVAAGDDAEISVPRAFVKDGKIVLNVSPTAVRDLLLTNEEISFRARFSGKEHRVSVPPRYVVAVFARENGAGMTFPEETGSPEPPASPDGPPSPSAPPTGGDDRPAGSKRPVLKLVK